MSDAMTKEEAAQFEAMRLADEQYQEPEAPPPQPQREPEPPAPEPEPPAPAREADLEPGPEPDAAGRVDKRALDEARITARQLREQLAKANAEHAANMARLDERFKLLQGAVEQHNAAQQQPQQNQIPDFNVDPAGHWEARFRQQEQQTRQISERQAQWEAQQRQQREVADLQSWGIAQEHAFAAQQPDYPQATKYLAEARARTLRVMGMTDEQQISQQVLMDVAALAQRARETGQNFGKALYDLAKAHGYSGQPQAQQGNGANGGNGAGLSAAERLSRGTDMATTLGATGGAARGQPSAAHIASMSEDEFAKFSAEVKKQGMVAFRNMMGA